MNREDKKVVSIIGLIAVVAVVAAVVFFFSSREDDLGQLVAEVDGQQVYSKEAEERLMILAAGKQGISYQTLNDEAKRILAKEVATQKLLLKKARNSGVENEENVRRQIKQFSDKIIKQAYLLKTARDSIHFYTIHRDGDYSSSRRARLAPKDFPTGA